MPDFAIRPRFTPADILTGLIVDHDGADLVEDAGGGIATWPNRVAAANPAVQTVVANRPALGSIDAELAADFDGVNDQLHYAAALHASATDLEIVVVVKADDAIATAWQALFVGNGGLAVLHIEDAGDQPAYYDGVLRAAGTPAITDKQIYRFHLAPGVGTIARNAQVLTSGLGFTSNVWAVGSSIGADDSNGSPLDGRIAKVMIWERLLRPREIHLVERQLIGRYALPLGAGVSSEPRVVASAATWNDPAFGGQPPRINPTLDHPHMHWVGTTGWLQLSAMVGGVDGPLDTALGGRLFSWRPLEWPGATEPWLFQDSGCSSVADVNCNVVGHYAIQARRSGGGAVIVHYDAVS